MRGPHQAPLPQEILVTFLLVNFFGFLVITRDHGNFGGATRWKFFLQASRSFLNRSGPTNSRKNLKKWNFKISKKSEHFNEY